MFCRIRFEFWRVSLFVLLSYDSSGVFLSATIVTACTVWGWKANYKRNRKPDFDCWWCELDFYTQRYYYLQLVIFWLWSRFIRKNKINIFVALLRPSFGVTWQCSYLIFFSCYAIIGRWNTSNMVLKSRPSSHVNVIHATKQGRP